MKLRRLFLLPSLALVAGSIVAGSAVAGSGAAGPVAAGTGPGEPDAREAFFARLSELCGARFEGSSSFPTDGPFAGEPLVARVETCNESEVRIPFAVGEDRSRTWILTRSEEGLLLKHDHRHADGTPDEITMYGGWADGAGSELSQAFPADDHTKTLLPEAATNVWTLTLDADAASLTYYLERHAEPRFKATLRRVESPAEGERP